MKSPTITKYGLLLLDAEQGSETWKQARLGKPTASNFNRIVTSQGKRTGEAYYKFLSELMAQYITGEVKDTKSAAMARGNEKEPEARAMYELISGNDVEEVGGVFADETQSIMVSPDGIIPSLNWGYETKNPGMENHIFYSLCRTVPTQYILQVQGNLAFTGFDKWVFHSHCKEYATEPDVILEIDRNEKLIDAIKKHVGAFSLTLEAMKSTYKQAKGN